MKVRVANSNDIPALVPLYMKFYETTDYNKIYQADIETITLLTDYIIQEGAMVVAEVDNIIVGSAGAYIGPATFNKNIRVATEVIFYLDPDVRGNSIAPILIWELEKQCKELGALSLQMMRLRNSSEKIDELYQLNGYRPSEFNFTKRLVD